MANKLSKTTILFHWIVGLMFITVLAVGLYVEEVPKGPEKWEILGLHKSFGFIVLMLAVARIVWRFKEGAIESGSVMSRAQEIVAKSVQHILLLGTVLMPVSGLMMSIGSGRSVDVFGVELLAAGDKIEWVAGAGHSIHEIVSKILILVILLHIAGALKHQFKEKDGSISRMLGR